LLLYSYKHLLLKYFEVHTVLFEVYALPPSLLINPMLLALYYYYIPPSLPTQMMKFRNEGINLMSVRGARNLLMFFSSGTYSICTTSTSTANSSSSSSTANGSSTGSIRRPRGGGRGIMQHTSSSSNNNNNNNNKNDSSGMTHSGHSADACCDHNHSHHHSHHHGSGQDKKHDGEFTAVASAEKTNAGTGQYLV